MPSTAAPTAAAPEAKRPTMTPLEREQAAALAEQRKRVAALAETHPGAGGEEKAASVQEKSLASVEPKAAPRKSGARRPRAGDDRLGGGARRRRLLGADRLRPRREGQRGAVGAQQGGAPDRSSATPRTPSFAPISGRARACSTASMSAPMRTPRAAGALCGRLRAAHVDCFLVAPGGGIITRPSPRTPASSRAKPAEPAPAKPTTAAMPAPKTAPSEAKPAAAAPPAKAEPAKASAETETKKPESKSDVPFRTMGLPGLPD